MRAFVRLHGGDAHAAEAMLAEEVPVAFVYSGHPYAVMMCTPADLEDLAVGFTLSEGIVTRLDEIGEVTVTRHSRGVELGIDVPESARERLASRARSISGRTGCGLCGVEAIDEAVRTPPRVTSRLTFTADALWRAGASLPDRQPLNDTTNTVHAAGWAAPDGELRVVREDVGRHNALDKVLGALWRSGDDAGAGFLLLTSRLSYELVQKAAVAGVPLIAAVSRPTGLAVRLADQAGITLVGLLRGETANVYSHAARVRTPSPIPLGQPL
ncbi:MAG: formate dehydrogenase accessory sulfurtransferase FdhD [Gemmatimonadetes bacterium]|nr:formate dehydrogenase accessory sulfurtransferase FdhD [Gemmatimonadota bacterium]